MKRLATLFIVLLPTLGIGAQTKAPYTERLDSIVTYGVWTERKIEFAYNVKGQTEQILYYQRNEDGWSLTNKREYFYDEQGRDTLRAVFDRKDGEWVLLQKRHNTYGSHGEKLQTRVVQYARGQMVTQLRCDYTYNQEGKQLSSSKYGRRQEKPEEWTKTEIIQNEYDAKGNQVKETYEYLNTQLPERGVAIMRYDKEGRLTTRIDSIYNTLLDGREWQRQDFSYYDGKLSMMKETLMTIDHNVVYQSMYESLFDPHENLLQTRRYKQVDGAWRNIYSISYFYNLNVEGSSIMGYEFVSDILGYLSPETLDLNFKEKSKYHHKLIMVSDIQCMDEDVEDDENNGKGRTRLYYSPL